MREEYYRSWVLGLGSWVLSFGSWVLPWILDPGSWTLFESTIPMYLFPVKIPDYHPANCGSGSGSGSGTVVTIKTLRHLPSCVVICGVSSESEIAIHERKKIPGDG